MTDKSNENDTIVLTGDEVTKLLCDALQSLGRLPAHDHDVEARLTYSSKPAFGGSHFRFEARVKR